MAFPTSGLVNNLVHKEGNRSFVYDSATGVWDRVREADTSNLDIQSGTIGPLVTGGAGLVTTPHRNMVINGDMKIAQKGTSVTGVGIDDYGSPDRYRNVSYSGSEAGRLTSTQTTITDLAGFTKGHKMQVTTADTSVAATDMSQMSQRIEQQDIEHIGVGTAGAKAFTFSFYARANAPITLCAGVGMGGTSGAFFTEKAITTSWQRFEVNMPATTVSSHKSAISSAIGVGMEVFIMLYAGSNLNTGTNSTWAAPANYVGRCNTNQGNFYSSTSNWLETTGWQLELGSTATPFEHRSFADELTRCQRYYCEPLANGACFVSGQNGASHMLAALPIPVPMRAAPNLTVAGTWHFLKTNGYSNSTATPPLTYDYIANNIQLGGNGGGTFSNGQDMHTGSVYIGNSTWKFDAEL